MGDYISRDMAIARLTKVEVTNRLATMTDAKREIAEMPAADVAPVVHGRETREGGSTMISEAVDRAVKAKWRADLVNMLTDAGRTLEHANLRTNGSVYQDINVGLLLLEAARSLQECQDEPEPEKPDDVGAKITLPDRWAMTEAWQRWAAQEAAADVAQVVHGEWEAADWREYDANSCEVICYPKDGIACTHCRYVFKKDALWKKNFCPNCGAKMDGGAENG